MPGRPPALEPPAALLRRCRRAAAALLAAVACAGAAASTALPPEVRHALQEAKVDPRHLSVVVQEAGTGAPVLFHEGRELVNPASLTKLVTTYAALDLFGPAWTWRTGVWLDGTVQGGVLDGSLVIRGSGDPTLAVERVWLLLQRVRQLGVHEIRGDIVLDRSAFAEPERSPADFDGEPLRPYNVKPDALLLNFKAVTYRFTPDAARGVAVIGVEPRLDGVAVDAEVPLGRGPCNDWRGALKATLDDPLRVRFEGAYPASCGERAWPVAYADPASYNARLLRALWLDGGGRLAGTVRDGRAPAGVPPTFEVESPPLAAVVRDINKHSNNVMAQQLFLTLAASTPGQASGLPSGALPQPAAPDAARQALARWVTARFGEPEPGFRLDNGSGLSRETRMTAQWLARLLQVAWGSPVMPELTASLPVTGLDGTLRRSRATSGRAHLKTGSLRDVAAVAGYVLGSSGRRYVLVAIVQHPNANAARPALDTLVQWTLDDTARR
ncbi:MAG: D-alanyl-D-alanine carboxypeptidase/D-alanyl-D-alanine-endopeptidase [Burkholderiaceae bacterium]|nr:D-alanyl-D-alanine carboxypeptidase/D-alanyl-D-alanine-endopeptidase [Burkholderiaceae bacterium]